MKYLSCGAIYKYSANAFELKVVKFSYIKKRIISFFEKVNILGVKHLDYQYFCIVATLINEGGEAPDGLAKIRTIKTKMNKDRTLELKK